MKRFFCLFCVILFTAFFSAPAPSSAHILRFLKPVKKNLKPAIVLTAFGTSTKAQKTFEFIDKQIRAAFPGHEIRWAFTSDIIRDKMNNIYRKKKINRTLYSLPQVLASLEANGYTKVVVQSLHIFPGEEYMHMIDQAKMPGLHIAIGEPVMATWEDAKKVLQGISGEFLKPDQGCNVMAGHGSPNTYAAPSTAVYLAFDRLLSVHYPNCFLGSVEGVPDKADALQRAEKYKGKNVRIIPLMLVAGDHVMHDIMGKKVNKEGEKSWAMELEAAGKKVSCPQTSVEGVKLYKGLGLYKVTNEIIIEHIKQALEDFS